MVLQLKLQTYYLDIKVIPDNPEKSAQNLVNFNKSPLIFNTLVTFINSRFKFFMIVNKLISDCHDDKDVSLLYN